MGQIIILNNVDFSTNALPIDEVYDNMLSETNSAASYGYSGQFVIDYEMPACTIVGILGHIPANTSDGGSTTIIGTRVFNNGSVEMKRKVEISLDLNNNEDQFVWFDEPLIVDEGDYLAIKKGSRIIDPNRNTSSCLCYGTLINAPYKLLISDDFAHGTKTSAGNAYTFYNVFYGYNL